MKSRFKNYFSRRARRERRVKKGFRVQVSGFRFMTPVSCLIFSENSAASSGAGERKV
jgi:hypothetical protein